MISHQFLVVLFICTIFTLPLEALEINYQGQITTRYSNYNLHQTLLNPNYEIFDVTNYEYRIYPNLHLNFKLRGLNSTLKIRPVYLKDEHTEKKELIIDNAYVDFCFGLTNFVSFGKMNIVDSVGLSYFPTDFLAKDIEIDYSKKEEERKSDREGNYLIRLEKLFKNLSLSFVYAPQIKDLQNEKQRFLTKLAFTLPNVDISFIHFYSTSSAYGINASSLLTDKLALHSEIALLSNSERKYLRKSKKISEDVYLYELYDPSDSKEVFIKALIGGHYTFTDRTNIIFEYFFNEEGYNNKEWNEFRGILEDSYKKYVSPPTGIPKEIFKSNLGVCNSLMTYRHLRKNYLFIRFWKPEVQSFDFIGSILLNLDDKSFVFFPEIKYKITSNIAVYLGSNIFSGAKNSEFGLVPYKNYFYADLRYFF